MKRKGGSSKQRAGHGTASLLGGPRRPREAQALGLPLTGLAFSLMAARSRVVTDSHPPRDANVPGPARAPFVHDGPPPRERPPTATRACVVAHARALSPVVAGLESSPAASRFPCYSRTRSTCCTAVEPDAA